MIEAYLGIQFKQKHPPKTASCFGGLSFAHLRLCHWKGQFIYNLFLTNKSSEVFIIVIIHIIPLSDTVWVMGRWKVDLYMVFSPKFIIWFPLHPVYPAPRRAIAPGPGPPFIVQVCSNPGSGTRHSCQESVGRHVGDRSKVSSKTLRQAVTSGLIPRLLKGEVFVATPSALEVSPTRITLWWDWNGSKLKEIVSWTADSLRHAKDRCLGEGFQGVSNSPTGLLGLQGTPLK